MNKIKPFDPEDQLIRSNVDYILACKPVSNLTEQEVLATLRLLQLHVQLTDKSNDVYVRANDPRLEDLDDSDRFLAMLINCEQRDVLLGTKRCMKLFGGTAYHWRKIAHQCPIVSTASALSEESYGYYGRGWLIAPHIVRLIRWILAKSDNKEIKELKGRY